MTLKAMRFNLAVLLAWALCHSISSSMAESPLPTTEQFHGALSSCAAGLNISVSSDLVGSITSIYDGQKTNGAATLREETKFLELFAKSDRPKVYDLYQKCILQILKPTKTGTEKGWLQWANLPTPENGCSGAQQTSDQALIIFGTNGVLVNRKANYGKVVALQVGACMMLSIGLGENGALIDADVYDDSGELIGKIRNNGWEFKKNDNITLDKSGDLSTIVVHDQNNVERLYVRYINENTIKARGTFTCAQPFKETVVATEKSMITPGSSTFERNCAINSGAGFVIQ